MGALRPEWAPPVTLWTAEIRVMLKPSVNDPPGQSIQNALVTLGFDGVRSVRAGKLILVAVEASDRAAAKEACTAMCEKLLANPVIETYNLTLTEASSPVP